MKRIFKAKPPTYDGTPEPKELKNWIREMEKVFDAVGCPEAQKVVNGVYYLRDQADLWWLYGKEAFMASPDSSWAAFTQALSTKFYPAHLQKQKTNEFYNLNIGNKSVEEYYKQFMELLRFVPDIVAHEQRKIMRFERADIGFTGQGRGRYLRYFGRYLWQGRFHLWSAAASKGEGCHN